MGITRIAIIDPVGQKAGLDHYDLSLANSLIGKSFNVKVYSNFGGKNDNAIVKKTFSFSLKRSWINSIRIISEFI